MGLITASGTISKVDSILAVFEIIAPTEQYLVSDSSEWSFQVGHLVKETLGAQDVLMPLVSE
jgi:hypothetical protein